MYEYSLRHLNGPTRREEILLRSASNRESLTRILLVEETKRTHGATTEKRGPEGKGKNVPDVTGDGDDARCILSRRRDRLARLARISSERSLYSAAMTTMRTVTRAKTHSRNGKIEEKREKRERAENPDLG